MTQDQLRQEFEQIMKSLPIKPDLRRSPLGLYRNLAVQSRWVGWQLAYVNYVGPVV